MGFKSPSLFYSRINSGRALSEAKRKGFCLLAAVALKRFHWVNGAGIFADDVAEVGGVDVLANPLAFQPFAIDEIAVQRHDDP